MKTKYLKQFNKSNLKNLWILMQSIIIIFFKTKLGFFFQAFMPDPEV